MGTESRGASLGLRQRGEGWGSGMWSVCVGPPGAKQQAGQSFSGANLASVRKLPKVPAASRGSAF